MNTKQVAYNALLPITGTVEVPADAKEVEIEDAIYDDAREAASYKSAWKQLEVVDIYELQKQ